MHEQLSVNLASRVDLFGYWLETMEQPLSARYTGVDLVIPSVQAVQLWTTPFGLR